MSFVSHSNSGQPRGLSSAQGFARRLAVGLGLIFALSLAATSPARAQSEDAASQSPARQSEAPQPLASAYDLCLKQAQDQPEQALIMTSDSGLVMDDIQVSHCRAEALLSLGRYEPAAELFEQLAAAFDQQAAGDAGFLLQQAAYAWQEAGQFQQAVAVIDLLIARFSGQADLWIQKASFQVQAGQASAALATLTSALDSLTTTASSQDLGKLWVYRAGAHRRLDQIDKAKAALVEALRQPDLDQPLYLLELALVEATQDNLPAARTAFEQIIQHFPTSPEAVLASRYLARLAE